MKEYKGWIITGAVIIAALVFLFLTPIGTKLRNDWGYSLQKADDATNYETRKTVEDSCRAMVMSYEQDKLTYEQYKDSDDKEEKSWAANAKMRANNTAVKYNEYVLKNSFVWEDNIPDDIQKELEVIQ